MVQMEKFIGYFESDYSLQGISKLKKRLQFRSLIVIEIKGR